MDSSAHDVSIKTARKIDSLPLVLVNAYIGLSMAIFVISPMFPEARNAVWSVAYGGAAMLCFSIGYMEATRLALATSRKSQPPRFLINTVITLMCIANLIYFLPMLWLATSYYGFSSVLDILSDLGENYRSKQKFIEELGSTNIGPLYTMLNLAAISQVVPYVVLPFYWDRLNIATVVAITLSGLVVSLFYLSIGTMAGVFYIITLAGGGWLAKRGYLMHHDNRAQQSLTNERHRIMLAMAVLGGMFFAFMVVSLASRLESDIIVTLPFLYSYDSPIYSILGRRLGDGFGLALSYVSQGWYGLGNSLELDFQWTEFRSFSRVINFYINRFSGIDTDIPPLSYPVRQELITGYPAFAHWHTIFPWFASDFTFVGTLFIFGGFGVVYGWSWVKAVREGCLVFASLFSLLTIGCLFINANSQILDNKNLTLALFGLLILIPFRKKIGYIK